MRMRTFGLLLVQIAGLIFPAAGALAAGSNGYGSSESRSAAPTARTTQSTTRGTVLDMPRAAADQGANASAPTARPDTPPRGMTRSRVLARYGNPVRKSGPVGQPPISRWDYPHYRLYFEYDHVLHAVVPDHPEPIAHTEQLQTGQR